ncbi:NnrS family protein [Pseudomonas huaxiensis]|uniref:NnrS family protein n=1 Tax=Pseudomonas huaxiensis TaxID=2213017 RepID=UPI001300A368|nr:NnrS family protein [Pseudomonas huaxiensis]
MSLQTRLAPLMICGFRPFFVLCAASASGLMLLWLLLMNGAGGNWQPPGGLVLWHAHELLFGFTAAAIAGFALTAVPEFTDSGEIKGRPLARLVLLWVLARLAYPLAAWLPEPLALWPAALCNLAFWTVLLMQLGPRLWRDPTRQHLSFAWVIGALALLQLGFFSTPFSSLDPVAWLRAATGALMVLIVVATSRISMSVVNGRIEEGRPGAPAPTNRYLARPPRRHLATFCIAVCSASEFALGADPVTGWTALAAAAAMLNLLNDWHVGRPLLNRWALMLYAGYWLIALGYGVMGAAWLGAPFGASVGRHVLTGGALSLTTLVVMAMVSRIHAGLWLDRRAWVPLCAALLLAATLLRAVSGLPLAGAATALLLNLSGILWAACFTVYLSCSWRVLSGPREDGQEGCAPPRTEQP